MNNSIGFQYEITFKMRTLSAYEYTMIASAQLLRNRREQRPSNEGDIYSNVVEEDVRVDLLLI
jgi:hypothetical protein